MIRAHAAHIVPPKGGIEVIPQTPENTFLSPSTIEISGHACVADYPELQKLISDHHGDFDWHHCFVIDFPGADALKTRITEVYPLVRPEVILVNMKSTPMKEMRDYVDWDLGGYFPEYTCDLIWSENHYIKYLQSAYSDFTCYIMVAFSQIPAKKS